MFPFWEEVRARVPAEVGLELEPSELAQGLVSELALRACAEASLSRGRAEEILSFQ